MCEHVADFVMRLYDCNGTISHLGGSVHACFPPQLVINHFSQLHESIH